MPLLPTAGIEGLPVQDRRFSVFPGHSCVPSLIPCGNSGRGEDVNAVRLGKFEPRYKRGPADPSEDPAACAESKAHATLSHEHTGPRDDRGAVAPESALRHRGGHPWTFWFTPFTFLLPFFFPPAITTPPRASFRVTRIRAWIPVRTWFLGGGRSGHVDSS